MIRNWPTLPTMKKVIQWVEILSEMAFLFSNTCLFMRLYVFPQLSYSWGFLRRPDEITLLFLLFSRTIKRERVIWSNFVAFSDYRNFINLWKRWNWECVFIRSFNTLWIYTISFLIKADIGRPLNSLFFLSLSPVMETLYETCNLRFGLGLASWLFDLYRSLRYYGLEPVENFM